MKSWFARGKFRGWDIVNNIDEWLFEDSLLPVNNSYETRPCGHCGLEYDETGHDPCIKNLIGVMNACCGHGDDKCAYLQFIDGECIRGNSARIVMGVLSSCDHDGIVADQE